MFSTGTTTNNNKKKKTNNSTAAFLHLFLFLLLGGGGGTVTGTSSTSFCSNNNNNNNNNGDVVNKNNNGDVDDIIKVYDNVLDEETAKWLHRYSVKEYERTTSPQRGGSKGTGRQFVFPLPAAAASTSTMQKEEATLDNDGGEDSTAIDDDDDVGPLIYTLNDIIHEMLKISSMNLNLEVSNTTTTTTTTTTAAGETTNITTNNGPMYYVEFWTRQSWQHILAHQDMDEGHYHRQRKMRANKTTTTTDDDVGDDFSFLLHPEYGHVLYLTKGSSVIGPTVVFNTTTGGSLLSEKDTTSSSSTTTTMVTVPVVPGRLLQFKGNLLHGVPRPYHVYWTLEQEYPPQTKPEHLYGRSVILFNLWPYSQGPVTDKHVVTVDVDLGGENGRGRNENGDRSEGEVENDDDNGTGFRRTSKDTADFDSIHRTTCNPSSSWKKVQVVSYSGVNDDGNECNDNQELDGTEKVVEGQGQQQKQHTSQGQKELTSSTTSLSSWLWSLIIPRDSSSNLQHQPQQQQFQIPLVGDEHRRGTTKFSIHLQTAKIATTTTTTKEREETVGGRGGPLEEMFQQQHQVSSIQVEPFSRKPKSTWFGIEL